MAKRDDADNRIRGEVRRVAESRDDSVVRAWLLMATSGQTETPGPAGRGTRRRVVGGRRRVRAK
jgi:hypothetical protein